MSTFVQNTCERRICNHKTDMVSMKDSNIFVHVDYNAEKADSKHSYIKCQVPEKHNIGFEVVKCG